MSRISKRSIIAKRKKEVHKLEAELDRIWTARANLGYIELPKPIRDGWYKTFRLRDDIMRTKNADVYQEILDAIALEVWGSEKKYADKNWRTYFKRNTKRYQRPGIKRLEVEDFNKLSIKAQKHFYKRTTCWYCRPEYACLLPSHYFIHTYKRAFIYKYKIVSSTLESRRKEIMNALEKKSLRPHSSYFNYHAHDYWKESKRERQKVKLQLAATRKVHTSPIEQPTLDVEYSFL